MQVDRQVVVKASAIGGGVLILLIVLFSLSGSDETEGPTATFTAVKGPLTISVTESGTIQAREKVIIKNQVEGRTTILTLIDEGKEVKKGDLLIELDASTLVDTKLDQQIRVQNAEASFIGARENLEVVKNQAESDTDRANLDLEFAKQDLKKYVEGEYPNEKKKSQAKITLAEEDLARAREKLKWSRKLHEEKYISYSELQADELAEKKAALDVELARNELSLLENFTYQRMLAELKSDVKQAGMALDRTKRKAKASVVQAQADLKAKEAEYGRQKDKLEKIGEQIKKAKIYAPSSGQVIYATSTRRGRHGRSVEPLEPGREVREYQELIHLPTTKSVKVEFSIHETSLRKVETGLIAKVTVDAIPGAVFSGSVASIAPLPDARSAWLNPDLKVYSSEVYLDGYNANLRAGMSCRVEILVAEYDKVVYVPIQCVTRVGRETGVYVLDGGDSKFRPVEIGLDNSRMVRIVKGLKEGEVVSMTPSLSRSEVGQGSMEPKEERDREPGETTPPATEERRPENRKQVGAEGGRPEMSREGAPRQERPRPDRKGR